MKTEKIDVYLRLDDHVRTQSHAVCLSDIASVYCKDTLLKMQMEALTIFSFGPEDGKKEVISLLYIYKKICEKLQKDVQLHSIGAEDCLVELYVPQKKKYGWAVLQAAFVSLVTFFGAAFSIMTYDEDAGVFDVFQKLYTLFGVPQSTVLEWSYSIGIALGVIVFFHHFEKKDERTPTAMEIQMNQYEQEVVETYVSRSKRRNQSLEVDS